MTKQELISEVKALREDDVLSRNLVIELLEQMDEPIECYNDVVATLGEEFFEDDFVCSNCRTDYVQEYNHSDFNYCPHCGARIERDKNNK